MLKWCRSPLLLATALIVLITAPAPASSWEFSQGEEDWGPTCFVNHKHATGKITILSSKGKFNPSLLVSLPKYPKNGQNIPIRFSIKPSGDYRLMGSISDYFGEIDVKLTRPHIDSFMKGQSLNITFEDTAPVKISLAGSSQALNAFLGCMQSSPKPASAPASPPAAPAIPNVTVPLRPATPTAPPPPQAFSPVPRPKAPAGLPQKFMQQLVGEYMRNPTENDWHRGAISLRGGQLVWSNRAGVSWKLYPDPANPNILNTGADNPYYARYPNARRFMLVGQSGRITGFTLGGSLYSRQMQARAGACAGQPLGSLRLPAGFTHQRAQGIDSIVGAVLKPGVLRIGYEIGRITPPGGVRTGGGFTDRAKRTPTADLKWSGAQIVNGQLVHLAYRRDNILLASFPGKGMNMNARITAPEQMTEAMLVILSYGGPDCRS